MKNLLIKTFILCLMFSVGYVMATTPPSGKEKAKKEVTCSQHTAATTHAVANNGTPANIPAWCQPVNCNPANCQPANCNPANCLPKSCKPIHCKKAASSCKSASNLQ